MSRQEADHIQKSLFIDGPPDTQAAVLGPLPHPKAEMSKCLLESTKPLEFIQPLDTVRRTGFFFSSFECIMVYVDGSV